ncbi:MAG: DNA polymerase III subunit delta [Termitinemataceae bacterium]|nr:MAG: DNA polymerase III subunit delta [Termitinemataceae bacterium]
MDKMVYMVKGESFIFAGQEIGERQDEIEKLRTAIKERYNIVPEESSFYIGEDSVSQIVSILLNGSLFSDARLFFVKNAELLKKKDEIELFLSYIKKPADDTTLVFITESNSIDKKLEEAVLSFGKNYKHIFWELFDDRKEMWLRNFFKRQGFIIDNDGINAILEMVENNTDALRRECSTISFFFNSKNEKNKVITAADIEALLSKTRSETAFTLFSAICEADFSKSLSLLHTLLSSGETPASIFPGLIWCFKRFRDYCTLSMNGTANEFELRKVGISTQKNKNDCRIAAKNFGFDAVNNFIALCAKYDIQSRVNDTSMHQLLMDLFLYKIFSTQLNPQKMQA